MENETLFTKIKKGEIPSVKLYEDDKCFVIMDINPINKGHALVISNDPYPNTVSTPDDVLTHMFLIAKKLDKKQREVFGCEGTNWIINNDRPAGQDIPHLHIHVTPRYLGDGKNHEPSHAKYEEGEIEELGKKLKL